MGGETFTLAEGAKQYSRNPFTGAVTEVASGAPKKEATPAEIQGFQLAQSQGFKGSFLDYELAKKKAGATNVNVTSGDKAFSSAFGTGVAKQVEQGFNAAQSANTTLARIGEIKPLLSGDQVYSGPLATSQVAATRIADKLGITGNTTAEKLSNTSKAMQQLAGLEMDAAQALSGQGAITENERALIKRAAGGDLMTMTAPEVNALLSGLEKTSKYKIKVHETNLTRLSKNKDLAPLAEYYKIDAIPQNAPPVQSPTAMPAGFRVVR
jgi:hypothetical protein